MNIIQAKHIVNSTDKVYTYQLPKGVFVRTDSLLLVENNQTGGRDLVKAVTNSEDVNDNILKMIMQGQNVRSKVLGMYFMIPILEADHE